MELSKQQPKLDESASIIAGHADIGPMITNKNTELYPPPVVDIIDCKDTQNVSRQSFLGRHAAKLGIGALALSLGFSATHIGETLDDVKDGAKWAVPIGLGTEALWNTGAAIMVISAGKKIGNPLKLRSNLREAASSLSGNTTFRVGSAINLVGAVGTSAIITGATVSELPASLWPGSLAVATASLVPSLALWRQVNKTASSNGDTN